MPPSSSTPSARIGPCSSTWRRPTVAIACACATRATRSSGWTRPGWQWWTTSRTRVALPRRPAAPARGPRPARRPVSATCAGSSSGRCWLRATTPPGSATRWRWRRSCATGWSSSCLGCRRCHNPHAGLPRSQHPLGRPRQGASHGPAGRRPRGLAGTHGEGRRRAGGVPRGAASRGTADAAGLGRHGLARAGLAGQHGHGDRARSGGAGGAVRPAAGLVAPAARRDPGPLDRRRARGRVRRSRGRSDPGAGPVVSTGRRRARPARAAERDGQPSLRDGTPARRGRLGVRGAAPPPRLAAIARARGQRPLRDPVAGTWPGPAGALRPPGARARRLRALQPRPAAPGRSGWGQFGPGERRAR